MCTKTVVICDFGGMDTWLTGGVLHELIFFVSYFQNQFSKKFFAVCFLALGKLFTVCPINGTRQNASLPTHICLVLCAVCNTW